MKTRKLLSAVLVASGLVFAACDGSSAGLAGPTHSDSFSPVFGTTASGGKSDVWWKYEMNGGRPLSLTMNGTSATATFTQETVSATGGGTKRTTDLGLTLATFASGSTVNESGTTEMDEVLMPGPPNAVVSSSMTENLTLSLQGMSARVAVAVMTQQSMPVVDFGDRTDLDQLPVGHVDEANVRRTATSTATASAEGMSQTNTATLTADVHETYTIMEQIPSMDVGGKTYQRVVRVEVRTDATNIATNQVTTSTTTLWLAAGVGAIKSTGGTSLVAAEFAAELVDTNLGQ